MNLAIANRSRVSWAYKVYYVNFQQTRMICIQWWKYDYMLSHFDTILQCDGQTNCYINITVLTHDKN